MKRFKSAKAMLEAHEAMFGEPGRIFAELVIKHANTLFKVPLDALNVRVVLAPIELGPYGKHSGYCAECDTGGFILANRNHCIITRDGIALHNEGVHGDIYKRAEDFIVHELTHQRQRMLLRENKWKVNRSRGAHRDLGWFWAVAEGAKNYLGIEIKPEHFPIKKSVRMDGKVVKVHRPGAMTEPQMCHWPAGVREWWLMREMEKEAA
jgi:hypothetical protein